ncbi:MAG: hypothetical protein RL743_1833, partial [Actinomycetota bacterium]
MQRNDANSMGAVPFSLMSDEFQSDPPAMFAVMREKCPVHHATEPAPHYSLTREADVAGSLRDDSTWSSKFGPGLAFGEPGSGVLVSSDPPAHTAERLAITRIFKPSAIEAMETDIRTLVYGLVEGFRERGRGDIIADLGMPVPLTIMCWMLGTPVEDIDKFRNWVLPMAEAVAY